ncbi:MAG TPA: hypothetical protein VK386_08040, partial [Acidimicrobiales bacterium]|nr:hypothetical protein [Acidimicrobiales bacterium]
GGPVTGGPVTGGPVSDPLAPVVVEVRPEPEPVVLAAIVAAVQECWPRPQPSAPARPATSVWRFSGRWWAKPTAARRERPWMGGTG